MQKMAKGLIIVETPLLAVLAQILTHSWILFSVLLVVGLIIFISISQKNYLKCRKCGNEQISNANVLHYKDNDESMLDVPKELIVIKYKYSIIPRM